MSLWIETMFVSRLCSRFRNFRQTKPNVWNFSCPICGDSKKNERKARGYIYENKQQLFYRCHNCGTSHTFNTFLKLMNPVLHDEYRIELFKDKNQNDPKHSRSETPADVKEITEQKSPKALREMKPVGSLPPDHAAVRYLIGRKIPRDKWKYFFFVEKYYAWINKISPLPDPDAKRSEHSRLIIPYFDKQYNIFRLTARAMDEKHSPKYLFTVIDDEKPSLYNYDFIDRNQRVYVVEGPIDSLFLPNCIAVGNANYGAPELKKLRHKVIVPDNQPRNSEVVNHIKQVIDMGYPVCIWDKVYGKDLNDMFKVGYTMEEIKDIIDRNTYSGVAAKLKFNEWKKC